MSQRQIELKEAFDAAQATTHLKDSDIQILRKLEVLLPKDDPLVVERESMREVIRKKVKGKQS